MIRLFTGFDSREAIGHAVFCHSVIKRASIPVSIIPIGSNVSHTDGTNAFSLARFRIPELCDYKGWAIWADGSDMLCLSDIKELWDLRDETKALQVVKHDYIPSQSIKYLGTNMQARNESYPRKNWSSLMLVNNSHPSNMGMVLDGHTGSYYHRFSWLSEFDIGSLPKEWNHLVSEENQCLPSEAKIAHATNGGWWFTNYAGQPFSLNWKAEFENMTNVVN